MKYRLKQIKRFLKHSSLRLKDFLHNVSLKRNKLHILFTREYYMNEDPYEHFIQWVAKHYPEIKKRTRMSRLDKSIDLKNTRLYVPWLQNVQSEFFEENHRRAVRIEDDCLKKNIPVINSLSASNNVIKSRALKILKETGLNTAPFTKIKNPKSFDPLKEGLKFPFFIREDFLHNKMVDFIANDDDLKNVNWDKYHKPIAIEFIDTCYPDGFYRKHRYVLVGDKGICRHLVISKNWFIHMKDRIKAPEFKEEELEYINQPDPNHDLLNHARKALKLDIVSFDYSYLKNGEIVVWEPNALTAYWAKANENKYFEYLTPSTHQIYQELLKYYCSQAGIPLKTIKEDKYLNLSP